jgi:hypothetical protein
MLGSGQTEEGKVKRMLSIFFYVRGIVYKESSWKASQSVVHTTVTIYGDCIKIRPELWQQKNCSSIMTTHHLALPFHQGILTKINMTVVPTHPQFSVSPIERPPF